MALSVSASGGVFETSLTLLKLLETHCYRQPPQSELIDQRRVPDEKVTHVCSSLAKGARLSFGSSFAWAVLCQCPLADPVEFRTHGEKEEHSAFF